MSRCYPANTKSCPYCIGTGYVLDLNSWIYCCNSCGSKFDNDERSKMEDRININGKIYTRQGINRVCVRSVQLCYAENDMESVLLELRLDTPAGCIMPDIKFHPGQRLAITLLEN